MPHLIRSIFRVWVQPIAEIFRCLLEGAERERERETDRQTDRQADRQAGRQAGRQADRDRETETETQTDSQTELAVVTTLTDTWRHVRTGVPGETEDVTPVFYGGRALVLELVACVTRSFASPETPNINLCL